jgi:hypothetical protein
MGQTESERDRDREREKRRIELRKKKEKEHTRKLNKNYTPSNSPEQACSINFCLVILGAQTLMCMGIRTILATMKFQY